jgi:Ni,Fe-hydrogenase I large subunit
VLRFGDQGPDPSPSLTHRGPENALAALKGRRIEDGVKFAGLLFPICPRAHQAAALGAAEAAMGIDLSLGQAAARQAVVLAEAIAACVWRSALDWPRLLAEPGLPEPVRRARAASELVARAVYRGDWASLGGAELSLKPVKLKQARADLSASVSQILAMQERITAHAEAHLGGAQLQPCGELGSQIGDPGIEPGASSVEETPRSMTSDRETSVQIADWFTAQIDHAHALLAELDAVIERLTDHAPIAEGAGQNGSGIGISITARGRLRHVMSVGAGIITDWRSSAPTDWNFAPGGPVIHYMNGLGTDATEAAARLIVAALDPCAPCDVRVTEQAHA